MAKIWLKKIGDEPALTIEAEDIPEHTCIGAFFTGKDELRATIKRFVYRGNTILEIRKEVKP